MKRSIAVAIICFGLVFSSLQVSHAGGVFKALQHSGKAIVHSTQAVLYGVVGSAQVVSGTLAIPLAISGSVGNVSGKIGNDMWDAATMPIGTPLEISDKSVTAGPSPDEALKDNQNAQRI